MYLGMPSYVGRKKTKLFTYVKDKVRKKLQSWQNRMLSKAGKIVLLNTVAQTIPNYIMSLFLLPKETCCEIEI